MVETDIETCVRTYSYSSMGKISDIWKAVQDQRPANVPKPKWQQSYDGVKAALKHAGFELVMTRESFDNIAIPVFQKRKHYSARKVVVARADLTSKPTAIDSLLSGKSGLLTEDERLAVNQKRAVAMVAQRPKGVATNNNAESRAIDELDLLLGTTSFLYRQHLYEFRLADIAYCLKEGAQPKTSEPTMSAAEVWAGDQIKHAVAQKDGVCSFNCSDPMTVADMISYLNAGLSLTCIGKSADDKVDVVWFFHGPNDVKWLTQFKHKQKFAPRLHLKNKSSNKFTEAYNAKEHRYDVGRSAEECNRLLERKLAAVREGPKHTLTYLNDDESQICGENHKLEHKAFALTRDACAGINVDVERVLQDAYGPVDFRVASVSRNQDKILRRQVKMRSSGGHPYNADTIDIFQLTDLDKQEVYALPMRLIKDGNVVSFFDETTLMQEHLGCTAAWKEAHKQHLFDFKDEAGIQAYVDACVAASQVPVLTDRQWYSNIITTNANKFGSKNQMKLMNAAEKIDASHADSQAAVDIDSEPDV